MMLFKLSLLFLTFSPVLILCCHAFTTITTSQTYRQHYSISSRCEESSLLFSVQQHQNQPLHSEGFGTKIPSSTAADEENITTNTRSTTSNSKNTRATTKLSPAAVWHQQRRKDMISKYSSQILPLEQESHGLFVGLPILLLSNFSLAALAVLSGRLTIPQIILLALFPGSMLSLWQLQICHDSLHGSLLPKRNFIAKTIAKEGRDSNVGMNLASYLVGRIIRYRKVLHMYILFLGTMPSAFGYYLYLQYGHLTHHKSLGDSETSNLETLFESSQKNFEDGDALFVAHRMKLKGGVAPKFNIKIPAIINQYINKNEQKKKDAIATITMSISNSGFSLWKDGHAFRNAAVFTTSFLFERILLIWNDFVVSLTGKNFFFPNKPKSFHKEVATYCRCSVAVRLGLCYLAKSWKALLFLYLAETLWTLPPHPACAMFVTNHGSKMKNESENSNDSNGGVDDDCIPSSSTYAGRLYSLFTLGTNFHVEHHDYPSIPLHKLSKLRKIAPEYYDDNGEKDNVFKIMKKTFAKPEFYACMDAGIKV
mmetsp:Transcript_9555/g.10536  ORF Transcript_9555/g.10536 Transcript_9555/m.10536 type:complete len:538 (+) Transcript_9555:124-1737(+)